jgi:hypothetical protein
LVSLVNLPKILNHKNGCETVTRLSEIIMKKKQTAKKKIPYYDQLLQEWYGADLYGTGK